MLLGDTLGAIEDCLWDGIGEQALSLVFLPGVAIDRGFNRRFTRVVLANLVRIELEFSKVAAREVGGDLVREIYWYMSDVESQLQIFDESVDNDLLGIVALKREVLGGII